MNKDLKFAILIDADNISEKYVKIILEETAKSGIATYKRIYGDWTNPQLGSWKKILLDNSIIPIQQYGYTTGKSSTDSAMIIDAMDILYAGNVDGFCLVSSDSDFTRLAARLRESRMFVIGMGESKTPTAFKAACDTFKYLDVLMGLKKDAAQQAGAEKAEKAEKPKAAKKQPARAAKKQAEKAKPAAKDAKEAKEPKEPKPDARPAEPHHDEELAAAFVPLDEIVEKVREIIDFDSDEDGYMPLSQIGIMLGRLYADFDSRNYGFSKLHKLIEHTGAFETKYEQLENGSKNLVVRNK